MKNEALIQAFEPHKPSTSLSWSHGCLDHVLTFLECSLGLPNQSGCGAMTRWPSTPSTARTCAHRCSSHPSPLWHPEMLHLGSPQKAASPKTGVPGQRCSACPEAGTQACCRITPARVAGLLVNFRVKIVINMFEAVACWQLVSIWAIAGIQDPRGRQQ